MRAGKINLLKESEGKTAQKLKPPSHCMPVKEFCPKTAADKNKKSAGQKLLI